jgi:primosomal protein N' (replication factor Y)
MTNLQFGTYEVWYAEVVLPVPLAHTYTYRVPQELNDSVQKGQRVLVQFGRKKIYAGVIFSLHQKPPEAYQAKYVLGILDDAPILKPEHLDFWSWVAEYYMCTLGEVMRFALPSALKLQSETKIVLKERNEDQPVELDEAEAIVLEILDQKGVTTAEEIDAAKPGKNTFKILKSLFAKDLIWLEEDVQEKYKPKEKSFIRLESSYQDHRNLEELFNQLEKKSTLQLHVLMSLITDDPKHEGLEKSAFIQKHGLSPSSVKTLTKNGVLMQYTKQVDRMQAFEGNVLDNQLNADQKEAYQNIDKAFESKNTVLLEGVTSSGKTHVYIQLMEDAIKKGHQVLYLLPEISLTTQLIQRIQTYFGTRAAVYHSKFNLHERYETWMKLHNGDLDIVIAPRSGIFLPFQNLGLVIVDEEHENTYKQFEPAPRYHARDAVSVLSKLTGAKVLLGSATPSIESYKNAMDGKYGYASLMKRYKEVMQPEIEVVHMGDCRKNGQVQGMFSQILLDEIKLTVEKKEQAVLFLNRKGYVPITECNVCSWSPKCTNCDITLTYYKSENHLKCHLCGYATPPISQCPACSNTAIRMIGYGTERIESDLKRIMPDLRTARLDQNTTRSRNSMERIIQSFEQGEIDVLVGTQMITKGLDFERLRLVGILDADHALNFPDFRAFERSYQLMTQVGGRAGRRKNKGKVIIQTNMPGHRIIRQVVEYDYKGMFDAELESRKNFHYPPFSRLIQISVKHKLESTAKNAATDLFQLLQSDFGQHIIGPEQPYVTRVRNMYIYNMLIKVYGSMSLVKVKQIIQVQTSKLKAQKAYKSVRWVLDVDPQ